MHTRTRGKRENWTPARNNAHGNLVPEAEKREPENEVEHITSFSLNNLALEEFFEGAKSVSMNGPKFSNTTGIMKSFNFLVFQLYWSHKQFISKAFLVERK